MAKVIAVYNKKGGCGKTTTATTLAYLLARCGKRTALIDLDSQGDSSLAYGVPNPDKLQTTILSLVKQVIIGEPLPSPSSYMYSYHGVDLVPSNEEISTLERNLSNVDFREYILKEYISQISPSYDYIIIDCTGPPPCGELPDISEVHISVTFTYDMQKAERLADMWSATGLPVRMGGPAFCEPGGAFVPGRYLKYGYVITSRGCPNRCWFCAVPKREGGVLRELPITSGWNVLDDNLLACSEAHIRAVFAMLMQRQERPAFTGGLEARLLRPWHVELLQASRAKRMFFAYDTPDDYEPLIAAGRLLRSGGITQTSHRAACYVLIGYPGDTMDAAEKRLLDTYRAGFWPFAMLYRDAGGKQAEQWHKFQRLWVRPQSVYHRIKTEFPDGFTEP